MARIRTIKPDFWDDEKISKLSLRARLLFIGLWNYCDDVGACRAGAVFLKSKIFPWDDISAKEIDKCLAELQKQGMIFLAQRDGESLLLVKNWKLHQVINKPSKNRVNKQTYDENLQWFNEHSGSVPVVVTEEYAGELEREVEGKGKGSGKGKESAEGLFPVPSAPAMHLMALSVYCEGWKRVYRSQKSPAIGPKDIAIIKRMVKDYGEPKAVDLIKAYLMMPDKWFVTKSHDLPTLTSNIAKISLFLNTGNMVSQGELKDLDNKVTQQNLLNAIERGEV